MSTTSASATITVAASDLLDALAACQPYLVSRLGSLRPAVALRSEHGRLIVATADYQSAIQLVVPCDGEWADSVVMPGAWLTQMITHLDGSLTLEAAQNHVRIKAGSFTATVPRLTDDAMPALERELQKPAVATVRITAADLHRVLNAALRATPKLNAERPQLNGVLLEPSDRALRVIGSDGYRLVMAVSQRAEIQLVGTGVPKRTAIIPRAAIVALTKTLATRDQGKEDTWLTMQLGQQRYRFDSETMRLVGSYLPGPYPDWERIMPRATEPVSCAVNRAEFQGALRRAALMVDHHDRHAIALTLRQDALSIQVQQPDGESHETIPASVVSASVDQRVLLNVTLLAPILDAFESDQLSLTLGASDQYKPVYLTAPTEPTVALVMPLNR